jgi:hypothetical protein
MKRVFAISLLFFIFFSCKKDSPSVSSQSVKGTLYYSDPAVDGPGLYFATDAGEPLLFKNQFSDYYTQYLHYKEWLGIHARLTFVDNGETGCSLGMVPCPQQHPMRLIEVVKLEKE